jgi:hypothetical protein
MSHLTELEFGGGVVATDMAHLTALGAVIGGVYF